MWLAGFLASGSLQIRIPDYAHAQIVGDDKPLNTAI